VVDDLVIFTQEHEKMSTNTDSLWIALDKKSGQVRWKLSRKTGPKTSYSTPCLYSPGSGVKQLIFNSNSHGITAVDPRNGTVIWDIESALPNRIVSSPVIADGLIIGTCGDGGSGKRLIAIRPGTSDKSIPPKEVYKIEDSSATYVPTAVAKGGLLFTFHDRGDVSCLRSATGERLWRERPAGKFFGSPVCVDNKLYCITTNGDVVVIKAAETYELLGINPLGETSHSTPAVAGSRMYLRTYTHLFSIGGK
jgi:outer membrane protein assembly factor BamB